LSLRDESGQLIDVSGFSIRSVVTKLGETIPISDKTIPLTGPTLTNFLVLPDSYKDATATVTLTFPSGYQITGRYCTNRGNGGCPDISGMSETLGPFNLVCGVDNEYGWILKPPTGCTFRSTIKLKDDNGQLIDVSGFSIRSVVTKPGETTPVSDKTIPLTGPTMTNFFVFPDSLKDTQAQVTLIPPSGYQITNRWCTNRGNGGCPDVSGTSETLGPFNLVCGLDNEYGWVLKPPEPLEPALCTYKATASVRDLYGNRLINIGDLNIIAEVINLTTGAIVSQKTVRLDGATRTDYLDLPDSYKNTIARITLKYPADQRIDGRWCGVIGNGRCPETTGSDAALSPFQLVCGSNYDFGWKLKPSPKLMTGWNKLIFPTLTGKTADQLPIVCSSGVTIKNNWIDPFVRNFSSLLIPFLPEMTYLVSCRETVDKW
jgi:hypothetical protein